MPTRNLSHHRSILDSIRKLNRQVMIQRELLIPRPDMFTGEKPILWRLLGVAREVGVIEA